MSVDSAFKTELIKDATIADITPDLTYAVVSGASSTTYQQFTASSNSNSSLNWSVQLPSESIVMGRDVLVNTTMTLTINCGSSTVGSAFSVPVGSNAFEYGVNSALSPFPFSQLISTASAQINNTTVAVNLPDVLPQFLALNDRSFLTEFNATTPSLPDGTYGTYADGIGANNNPLANYSIAPTQQALLVGDPLLVTRNMPTASVEYAETPFTEARTLLEEVYHTILNEDRSYTPILARAFIGYWEHQGQPIEAILNQQPIRLRKQLNEFKKIFDAGMINATGRRRVSL